MHHVNWKAARIPECLSMSECILCINTMHLVNRRSLSHRLSFRAERNAISTWTDVPSLSLVVVSQNCSGGEASIVWGHNDSNRCPAPLASSKQHQDQDVNNMHDDWSKGCTVVGSCPCNPNRGMSLNEDQTWHNTKLKHWHPSAHGSIRNPSKLHRLRSWMLAIYENKWQCRQLMISKLFIGHTQSCILQKLVNANTMDAIGIARNLQQNRVIQQHVHQTWQIAKLHRKHRFWHCLRLQTVIPRNISRMDQHSCHHRHGKQPWRIHEGPLDA